MRAFEFYYRGQGDNALKAQESGASYSSASSCVADRVQAEQKVIASRFRLPCAIVGNANQKLNPYLMARKHIDHNDILQFARDRVNLPRDKGSEYRAQARRLRERLDSYLSEHPDFSLRKMLLSGSVAKGTALRTLNDIDVACYISGAEAPREIKELLQYLEQNLQNAFPNFSNEQVQPQTYCVTVSFVSSGLDVDVVPILYDGKDNWYGDLVSQDDGSFLETSIPLHKEFIKKRKDDHDDFTQVIRLLKYWVEKEERERSDFKLKSFIVEMILAHLADQGLDLSDYPEALQHFFTYLARTGLRDRIVFDDYYDPSVVGSISDPIQVIDPVNPDNNAARLYSVAQADAIADAALYAGDAIDYALHCTTKGEAVEAWQRVFGSSFQA